MKDFEKQMQGYVKIKDKPGLIRDLHSKAILNTNIEELKEYKSKVALAERINVVENQLNTMKKDVETIKQILTTIVGILNVNS